jgi:predicted  nucleic acid-binding Zn-ribbon protein
MDQVQRFVNLQEKIKTLSGEKIRIEERYKAETEKLQQLVTEIQKKGYDPTKLAEIKGEKEKELEKNLLDLETAVQTVSTKLKAIEDSNANTNS